MHKMMIKQNISNSKKYEVLKTIDINMLARLRA